MDVIIIEDELPAQLNLVNLLKINCPHLNVIAIYSSVKEAIAKLPSANPHIIFMDVELSDGRCFDIFEQVEISAKVIITTAYDSYAIKAFKVNSIDYLLKPIDKTELKSAVARCEESINSSKLDINAIKSIINSPEKSEKKKRLIVKLGDKINIINIPDISYFYSEDKSTFMVTKQGEKHILDLSLEAVQEEVSGHKFFRVSRNCLVSIDSIVNITKHRSHRLKLTLSPTPSSSLEVFVSRVRVDDFMSWIEQS